MYIWIILPEKSIMVSMFVIMMYINCLMTKVNGTKSQSKDVSAYM